MKKRIGSVVSGDTKLSYYVFGTKKRGFGVGIEKIKRERATVVLAADEAPALRFASFLCRGGAYPDHLEELLADAAFDKN